MEREVLVGILKGTLSITPAAQDTSFLELLPEGVSLMDYGQEICLHVRVSYLLRI